jgi:hypothetical protein
MSDYLITLFAEVLAIISILGHLIVHIIRRTEEKTLLGYLHGIKPLFQSAAAGEPVGKRAWEGAVDQINDMMARLQHPKS